MLTNIGIYNLNILAPGNYTLETAVNKLLELVRTEKNITAGTELTFSDIDGNIRKFVFTYTGDGVETKL